MVCLVGEALPAPDDPAQANATQNALLPRRIITIAPNSAEIICALGACDRIVAVTKYCRFPSELASRPLIGGFVDPDLEHILALRPDLIVLRGHNEAVESLCRKHGIQIYRDDTQALAEIEKTTLELGRLLGSNAEARGVVERMRRGIQAIRDRVAHRAKPRVFLTFARQPDRLADLLTAGPGTFLDEMIEIAGGRNVFADVDMRYPQVSLEGIMVKRPDVILELMPEVTLTPELRQSMLDQWRRMSTIPAVANDRVYFLGDENALIPSPRYVEIIDKVSRLLHPENPRESTPRRGDAP